MSFESGLTRAVFIAVICNLMIDSTRADNVDEYVLSQMRARRIPGLSIAIIDAGKIAKAKGYGFADEGRVAPVTSSTLFQAASISKAVTAVAALRLAGQGKLPLDLDVNTILKTWKVPENRYSREKPVTVREILSHSAGFTVHGFAGYEAGAPLPTLTQILDGAKPAHNSPIRVNLLPGSKWRYSGGGYEVLQQILFDATGAAFAEFMRQTVLDPFDMNSSTFEEPLPKPLAGSAAAGFDTNRAPISGQWHIYPEQAAAGLWTTPSDLAQFAIALQRSYAGTANPVLSQSMTREMLKTQIAVGAPIKDPSRFGIALYDGLGLFLENHGSKLWFGHDGRNAGFDCALLASAETGQGVAVMINANDNSGTLNRIINFVAREYHWPGAASD